MTINRRELEQTEVYKDLDFDEKQLYNIYNAPNIGTVEMVKVLAAHIVRLERKIDDLTSGSIYDNLTQ